MFDRVTSNPLYIENMFRYYLAVLKQVKDEKDAIRSAIKNQNKLASQKGGPLDLFDEVLSLLDKHLPHLNDLSLSLILNVTTLPSTLSLHTPLHSLRRDV